MTTPEILERFDITAITLYRWQIKKQGNRALFPKVKIQSRPNHYLRQEVDDWEAAL
ncbi:hypothetical protein [Pseudoalteromonas sp. PPB1]|uniref:hypothetical protein n=1 Tax=Pseudoalteromonas sp. PPB1 TaxID=2756136 RepID=UPI001E5C47F7|nr:hypothetical protein [Pseudoalteromonas sp. PPB1]